MRIFLINSNYFIQASKHRKISARFFFLILKLTVKTKHARVENSTRVPSKQKKKKITGSILNSLLSKKVKRINKKFLTKKVFNHRNEFLFL